MNSFDVVKSYVLWAMVSNVLRLRKFCGPVAVRGGGGEDLFEKGSVALDTLVHLDELDVDKEEDCEVLLIPR